MNKKTVTIFGSSRPEEGEKEFKVAYELGKKLAENNFNVCTGGFRGIMHAASKGAYDAGGEAIGILVDLWHAEPSEFLTKEIHCDSLFDRIKTLIEKGDGYVILQGGTGTLLELSALWELLNKQLINKKPAAAHSQMWKDIIAVMEKQIESEERQIGLIKCFDTVDGIVNYLKRALE